MKVGDTVKLISNEFEKWDSHCNPLWKGRHGEIKGKIIFIRILRSRNDNEYNIRVKWDNDIENIYREKHLSLMRNINCDKIIVV